MIVVEAAERLRRADHRPARDGAGPRRLRRAGQCRQPRSRGCHRLLRDGAALVESADDVLEVLGPLVEAAPCDDGRTVHHPAELLLNDMEQKVLDAIRGEPTSVDEVVVASGLPVPQVLSTLSVLEMRHLIRRLSGTTVVRL